MTRNNREILRVGVVPFLNARPLVKYLNTPEQQRLALKPEVPGVLAEMMKRQELDVALLPSIEYFRAADYYILPDISISADGPVQSVMIFSKVPLERIRSLALDETSRTSVALTKILLTRKLGTVPVLTQCTPGCDLDDTTADAMMLIGDAAMTLRSQGSPFALDLGEEWKRQTGLPFVYAMWVARKGVDIGDLHQRLLKARDAGLSNIDSIALEASRELNLDVEVCRNYLRNIMRYELGEQELDALRLFQQLAAEDGLCQGGVEIVIRH